MRRSDGFVVGMVALFFLTGCGIIYTNVHVPRAYRSATPADVKVQGNDKLVTGMACNQSILFLAAWGNGGYVAATRDALKNEPEGAMLYDVKADLKAQSYVLGLYARVCTIVSGKVSTP